VRLAPGEPCAACAADDAWVRHRDRPLVIDEAAIAVAMARRLGEADTQRWRRRLATVVVPAATVTLGAAAAWFAVAVLTPGPVGPLAELIDALVAVAGKAAVLGALAVVAGGVALWRLRRRREFRRIPLLVPHLLAVMAGLGALVIGGVQSWQLASPTTMRHLTMPPLIAPATPSPTAERVMNATAVIVAPGEAGTAAGMGIGSGAIVARDARRAWIITCSHVAMPYAAVGAVKRAADAWPVWVQLADGRGARGQVRWTAPPPLDVALVEVEIAGAPEPVLLSVDTAELTPASPVMFVPNPYRDGWTVHRGSVLRREPHRTPAGEYSLVYTDLPVIEGDSGSGLFDERGRLVGVNTWRRIGPGDPQGITLPAEAMRAITSAAVDGRLERLDDLLTDRSAPTEGSP
jgi:S1-C subfamily serine protease